MSFDDGDRRLFADHGLEDSFGHRGLGVVTILAEPNVFALGAVLLHVIRQLTGDKILEDAADHCTILDIAFAEAAARHAADMVVILDQRNAAP